MHKTLPDVDFESSRSPAKPESWNNPSLQCWAVLPTWPHCRESLVWWCMKSILPNVCRNPESILWQIVPICWLNTKMYGLPIRARYKHFDSIWDQTCDNSLLFSYSSFLILWSSKQGLPRWSFCARFVSHPGNFSVAPAEIRDSNILLYCPMIFSLGLHSRWAHPK